MNPCLTDGALGLWLTVTERGTLEVEQTVVYRGVRVGLPPLQRTWIQHGVQAEQLLFGDLTYIDGRPTASAARWTEGRRRQDLRTVTSYRPYSEVLRVGVPGWPRSEGDKNSVAMTIKYLARAEKMEGDKASFQLSLDIPTEVVDWDGLTYTRTQCFCDAEALPLTVSLSAPAVVEPGEVALTTSHGSRAALEARPGGSRRFWTLRKDVKLSERDPLLLWLTVPRRHVSGARTRSAWQAMQAWFYPDRSYVSVALRVLVSLLLLVALARIVRVRRLRSAYLFLRVGAGNLALLAPLLLESLGLFHLQRFGLIEWSIVSFNATFDLLAVFVVLAVAIDRRLVAFMHKVGDGWPEPLFGQLLLARAAGRSPGELERLATAHLVLRNGDLLPVPEQTPEQVLLHLDQAAAHHLTRGDIEVVGQLRSIPRGTLELEVPLLNRVVRLRAAGRHGSTARRRADAAFEEAMAALGCSPAYRASHDSGADAFAKALRQDLVWLLATPAGARHLRDQLHQLERVGGFNIEPLRGLRGLVNGLA